VKRLLAGAFLTLMLVALSWPAASSADHVSITASVSARLKERASSQAWTVEVSWEIECEGVVSKGASYTGNLYLLDVDTGERTFLGGVSVPAGTARQLAYVRTRPRQVKPELQISCFDNNTLGGRGNDTLQGGAGDDRLTGGRGGDALAGGPARTPTTLAAATTSSTQRTTVGSSCAAVRGSTVSASTDATASAAANT
jgi:Ca2+-binding RTX toxin-like protein